jgi:integrase
MESIDDVAPGLRAPIGAPVTLRWFGSTPRLFAAGLPVTAVNLALRDRVAAGATSASVRSYAFGAKLFLSFLARRRLSLFEITNADFARFVRALVGQSFLDADGAERHLDGHRTATTGQAIVSRLYGLFGDIETSYNITFDWRRFRPASYRSGFRTQAREHRFRVAARKPIGLPDEQFGRMLAFAVDLWGDEIANGDSAFASDPEAQRGALVARNVAVLMLLRFAGARRAEVAPLDLADIDRIGGSISLVTKGRHGGKEPVVLLPVVDAALARYLFLFRPYGLRPFRPGSRQRPGAIDKVAVLLSHSAHHYGERISNETVRLVVDRLRPAVEPPWRERLHPHMLRHAFAHELQRSVGSFAASANLRHRSLSSIDAYRSDALQWADSLRQVNAGAAELLAAAGLRVTL